MSGQVGRFAPTPSGRMHIGNVYAMLAAWLSAHQNGDSGKVLLRIEDVDGPRALKDADKWIMDDLHWLGLDWDGDPVYQSRRTGIYEEALRSLESISLGDVVHKDGQYSQSSGFDDSAVSENGRGSLQSRADQGATGRSFVQKHATANGGLSSGGFPLVYPCFCSRADLRAASAPQEGDRFLIYPGTCRKLLAEHPDEVRSRLEAGARHSLRIAVPPQGAPENIVAFNDRIFGRQRFDLPREVGDTVIRRSDGIFSYQLAVVVDDLLMGVNDIVRGRDLLRSAALQIWIRQALVASGFAAKYGIRQVDNPAYAHLPLIDDQTGTRLAKRKHSLDIGTLRRNGVRPEQVIGYCAWLLGVCGSHDVHIPDTSRPVEMSVQEALQYFSFDAIRADKTDRALRPNWASELTGAKTSV